MAGRKRRIWGATALAVVVGIGVWAGGTRAAAAQSSDRLEGYYYPKVTSHEVYVSRARTLQDSTRARRGEAEVSATGGVLLEDTRENEGRICESAAPCVPIPRFP